VISVGICLSHLLFQLLIEVKNLIISRHYCKNKSRSECLRQYYGDGDEFVEGNEGLSRMACLALKNLDFAERRIGVFILGKDDFPAAQSFEKNDSRFYIMPV